MTATVDAPLAPALPIQKPVAAPDADRGGYRRLSVAEFDAMFEAGILAEGEKVELLRGIIVEKMGVGSVHDYIVRRLITLLFARLSAKHEIGVQSPVQISADSKLEPDHWVSRQPPRSHREATVAAGDLLLVVEVADSSIDYDRGTKLELYAEAGIPEYWIVDVKARLLECYTAPAPARKAYDTKQTYRDGQTFAHALAGEIVLAEVLGGETTARPGSLP